MSKDLSEYSKAYYELNEIYERFSTCEDYPNLIEKELKSIIKDRIILDAGCGTGKYLKKFQEITKKIYGIDLSEKQLEIAKEKVNNNVSLICSDLETTEIKDNTFDVIYSTWVLGTINSIQKRNNILKELKRILKPNGIIILVENNIGGEFETIRNRFPNTDKTMKYNQWIIKNKFKVLKELDTYFKFKNDEEAFYILEKIYGKSIALKAKNKINHKVIIYYLTI